MSPGSLGGNEDASASVELPDNLSDIESEEDEEKVEKEQIESSSCNLPFEEPASISNAGDTLEDVTEQTEDTDKDDHDKPLTVRTEEIGEGETTIEEKKNNDDALSDLSLSEDEFGKEDSNWVVLDEAGEDEKAETREMCVKCDVSHKVGTRCSFVLQSSGSGSGSGSGRGGRPRSARSQTRERVRTLPPELYENPLERERRSFRSRSPTFPSSRAPSRRVAPPPPSPPHFGENNCKLCGSRAHLVEQCPDFFCHNCSQQGHFAKECLAYAQNQNQPPLQPQYRSPCLLNNYSESLNSLYELQRYLSAKMISMPGQPYPNTYIDLLVSNVGKMLAQAGLGLR